jgi:hypothetical protein
MRTESRDEPTQSSSLSPQSSLWDLGDDRRNAAELGN